MQYKSLSQLAKAYKDGKLAKKNKLVVENGVATVKAVPVDKKTKKPTAGAEPEVVYQATTEELLRDALKVAGVPLATA